MFNLIDVGERSGSGIPNIFSVWNKQGWSAPVITESFEPDRITLSLHIGESSDKKVAIKSSDKKVATKSGGKSSKAKSLIQKQAITEYITEHTSAKTSEIAALLGVKDARARRLILEMIDEGIVVPEGENRNRTYKLKA